MKTPVFLKEISHNLSNNFKKFSTCSKINKDEVIYCCTWPIKDKIDFNNALSDLAYFPLYYWKCRSGNEEALAASGEKIFSSNSTTDSYNNHIAQIINSAAHIRIYGGQRFDQSRKISPHWLDFGQYFYFLPSFEIRKINQKYFFICNFLHNKSINKDLFLKKSLANMAAFIDAVISTKATKPLRNKLDFTLKDNYSNFKQNIDKILHNIHYGNAKKVVLANCLQIKTEPKSTIQSIQQHICTGALNSYSFLLKINHDTMFFGLSPERLFKRTKSNILVDSLAATIRKNSRISDKENEEALLSHKKSLQEQEIVTHRLIKQLQQLCFEHHIVDDKSTITLSTMQHIYTKISGTLIDNDDFAILKSLHPTPAVCGSPTKVALKLIRELEDFDRGMYCGPIGYFSKDCCEMIVAIRCALLSKNHLYLYAGAGIVKDSDANSEWQEISTKTSVIYNTLQDNNHCTQ